MPTIVYCASCGKGQVEVETFKCDKCGGTRREDHCLFIGGADYGGSVDENGVVTQWSRSVEDQVRQAIEASEK